MNTVTIEVPEGTTPVPILDTTISMIRNIKFTPWIGTDRNISRTRDKLFREVFDQVTTNTPL